MPSNRRFTTKPLLTTIVLFALLSLLTACGGPTAGGTPPPNGGGAGNGGGGQVASRQQLQAVAAAVYGDLADGKAASGDDVSALFGLFGVPTVPASDGDAFDAAVAGGDPFLLDFQADAMAQRLDDGMLVPVSSFIADLAEKGATDQNGATLDEPELTAALAPLLDDDSYQAEQLLPALVLWLGQERATRQKDLTDPVWGDGMLDPLQFNLLLIGMNLASQATASGAIASPSLQAGAPVGTQPEPTHPEPTQHEPAQPAPQGLGSRSPSAIGPQGLSSLLPTLGPLAPKAAKFGVKSLVTSWIASHVHFPLGPIGSSQAAICTSILLYSYKVNVQVDPDEVYTREYDHPERPYQSHMVATLNFDFHQDVDNFPKQVGLWLAGCDLPPTGIASGKPVTWTLHDQLPDLGTLQDATTTTDATGKAKATYTTVDEVVPQELRFPHSFHAATGAVVVTAHDLVPKWKNLVAVIRIGQPDLGQGTAFLTVFHYQVPDLVLSFDSDISQPAPGGGDIWRGIVSATVPLRLVDGGTPDARYQGDATLHFDSFTFTEFPPCSVSTHTVDGKLHVQTTPLTRSAGALELHVSFEPAPQDPGQITCPEGGSGPISGNVWQGGWIVLHQDELAGDGTGTYVITGWHGGDEQVTKSYDRSYQDESETLLTESTSLVLTAGE